MLEERGLPTTVIASVLPQVEKTRPPRALFVPFMLGRPFGEPGDAAFQRRVMVQALQLLTRTDGPVMLEHFPDDNPSWFDRDGWQASVALPAPTPPAANDANGWKAAFGAELSQILPAWERFRTRFGRTSVGLSGQAVEQWPAFTAAYLAGETPVVPLHGTPALSLRFLVDDIKTLYGEAAQADGEQPSARQIDTWFWRQTLAGQLLLALRAMSLDSPNNGLKTVGGRFFVPAPYLPATGSG